MPSRRDFSHRSPILHARAEVESTFSLVGKSIRSLSNRRSGLQTPAIRAIGQKFLKYFLLFS